MRVPHLGICVGTLKVFLGIGRSGVHLIFCSAPQRFSIGIVMGRLPPRPFRVGSSSFLLREALQVIQLIPATCSTVSVNLSCHHVFFIIPDPSQKSFIMGGDQHPYRCEYNNVNVQGWEEMQEITDEHIFCHVPVTYRCMNMRATER